VVSKDPVYVYARVFAYVVEVVAALGIVFCFIGALRLNYQSDFYGAMLWSYFVNLCWCLLILGVSLIVRLLVLRR
jgi:hypothetical protein